MSEFMSMYNLKNVIKHKTCFANPENPNSHKLIVTVLKHYPPPTPTPLKKKVIFRDYQNFQNNNFRAELDNEIFKCDLNNMEYPSIY